MNSSLKIDPQFESLINPLTKEEFKLLKENILSAGKLYNPIFVWNGYIVDGHHRYRILMHHPEVQFQIENICFESRYEAITWICNNQLGRRNLTPSKKRYLVGIKYKNEKLTHGSTERFNNADSPSDKFCHLENDKGRTRKRIAEEANVSEGYVMYAEQFADGVDAAEEVLPGIKEKILSGEIKKPVREIAAIAKAPIEKRKELTENLRQTRISVKTDSEDKKMISKIGEEMHSDRSPNKDETIYVSLEGAVDMFIETCKNIFSVNPELLKNEQYKGKTFKILQEAVNYISKMKEV